MKIYMDACCFNRPFDDQMQDRIRIESDAILAILKKCMTGELQLLSSEVLDSEIEKTPDNWKKTRVSELYKLANEKIMLNDLVIKRAYEIQKVGIKPFDSLHLAIAEHAKAEVFLTTDKNLLLLSNRLNVNLKISNPISWFMEVDEK